MQINGRKTQPKPVRTVFGGSPQFILVEGEVNKESLFTKRRVPSTDELGSLLHSNLGSTLAAAKAYEAQQEIC